MSASDLLPFFQERYSEVEEYLDLLGEVEKAAQSGRPKLEGSTHGITTSQQRILYSSVYLQLYNLVEATISRCVAAISDAATDGAAWQPMHLNEKLQQEWVRSIARTNVPLTPEKRLKSAMDMCNHLIDQLPIVDLEFEVGGGGNWDDDAIEKVSTRLGCNLQITRPTKAAVKRPLRDEYGPLKLVKLRRNDLAHGSISFVDCADGVAVAELRRTAEVVGAYLQEVIDCFVKYVNGYEFLRPEHKPQSTSGGAA
jgi:hypothetical protein